MRRLQESKTTLERKVRGLGVNSRRLRKKYKIDKEAIEIDKCMVSHIKENLTKEHLEKFSDKDGIYCPVTGQRMYVKACLARTFLKGHPRHKACEKCEKLYNHIVDLLKEIDKKTTEPGEVK